MGIFSRSLRLVESAAALPGTTGSMRNRVRVATPSAENTLRSVAYADLLGVDHQIVTRDQAITVPAVAAGRWLICNPLSTAPMVCYEQDAPTVDQPAWLSRTGTQVPTEFRTMWTLDDLIFEGWSLWRVERDTTDGWTTADGTFVRAITGATRVPLERWDFDADDQVTIDDEVVDALDVILFQSPMDPLLVAGRRTIRGAIALEDQWLKGLDAVPVMEIRQTEEIELEDGEDDEGQEIVDNYVAARKTANGAVVFTPHGYELVPHGTVQPDLFVNGRNFQVLDIARHLALPPHLMGASQVAASLTYSTQKDGRSDYRDLVQATWAAAITSRLSLDDCVPPGTSVKFDLSALAETPDTGLGPTLED